MAKKRTPIPSDVEAEVMFSHDRTCCVCRTPRMGTQIHHIDEEPSNHEIQNLAVLCLECHHRTQVTSGFARTLSAPLVRKFRDDSVTWVAERRKAAPEYAARGEAISFPGNRPSIRVKGSHIVDSYLVSSFTDNGVGDYTVNFIEPLDMNKLVVHVDGDESLQYKIESQSGSGQRAHQIHGSGS